VTASAEFLNAAVNRALRDPALRRTYEAAGYDIHGGTAAEFGELIRKETDQWARVIRENGIKAE